MVNYSTIGFKPCNFKFKKHLIKLDHTRGNHEVTKLQSLCRFKTYELQNFLHSATGHVNYLDIHHLVSLVGKVRVYRAGGWGSIPGWTNTQGLEIIEKVLFLP